MKRTGLLLTVLLFGIGIGAALTQIAGGTGSDKVVTNSSSAQSNDLARDDDNELSSGISESGTDWCVEHRVPESECTICHPQLVERFRSEGNWCAEHGVPESHCRKCNPRLVFAQEPIEPVTAEPVLASVFFPANVQGCGSDQAVIRFATAETASRIGLTVEPVMVADRVVAAEAPAEVVFDETRTIAVTTTIPATVIRWLIEPGQRVDAGRPLVELESLEMADSKADFLAAKADWLLADRKFRRAKELNERGLVSRLEFEDTEAQESAARSKFEGAKSGLLSVGLSDEALAGLESTHDTGARWTVHARQSTVVLERRAPLGELLPAGSTLALMGEPGALWIEAHVREQDVSRFRIGQMIEFTSDGGQVAHTSGEVIWISQYLELQTRTGLVRARVRNGTAGLQANRFGRVQVSVTNGEPVLYVPKDAVQWEGCCNVVFVQEASDRYRPRKVSIERGDAGHYAVLDGLSKGELVVTAGSFLLKTELKKESLGAGCVGE